MHDQYYNNTPDYDKLIKETRTFINLIDEEVAEGLTKDELQEAAKQRKIASEFLQMIQSIQ